MFYSTKVATCSEIHAKYIKSLCGQNVKFFNNKPVGTLKHLLGFQWLIFLFGLRIQYTIAKGRWMILG